MTETDSVARWYVAHTYSGYENKVKDDLEQTIKNRELENKILEVAVPVQNIVEMKSGSDKPVSQKKLFPGYVLVKMILDDETWYVVRNTRGVTGFVGPGSKPVPLSDDEIEMLGDKQKELVIDFKEGDSVVVTDPDSPWNDTIGTIKSINMSKRMMVIIVEFLGQETPLELSFGVVKKL